MSHKHSVFISCVAIVALYVSVYYVNVAALTPPGKGAVSPSRIPQNVPEYVYFDRLSYIVFYPMYRLDLWLRPTYWNS